MYVIGYIVALVTSYSMKMIVATNWALFFMPLFEHELVSGLNFAKNSFICFSTSVSGYEENPPKQKTCNNLYAK